MTTPETEARARRRACARHPGTRKGPTKIKGEPSGDCARGVLVAAVTPRQDRGPTKGAPVVTPIDPTSAGFLLAENRNMPMHVGGLQLFKKPEGAGRNYVREMYEQMRDVEEIAPLFLKRPAPLAQDRRPAGLGARRAVRHRAPRPAQRAAQARPGPRAARALLPPAQHPARLGAPALGGARHRGPARRPGRDVHQDPPRPGRRRLRDAAAAERAQHRPRPARHAGACGRRARPRAARKATAEPSTASPRCPSPRCARALGITAEAAGLPSALIKTLTKGRQERDLGALPLRAAHDLQPEHHRLAPVRRPGLADRAAARHRQGHRHHDQRRRDGDVLRRGAHLPPRARRAPRGPAGGDGAGRAQRQAVADRLGRGRQRRRRGDGAAGHRPARPGQAARRRSTSR